MGRLAGKGEQGPRGGALAANAHVVDRFERGDGAAEDDEKCLGPRWRERC